VLSNKEREREREREREPTIFGNDITWTHINTTQARLSLRLSLQHIIYISLFGIYNWNDDDDDYDDDIETS
jgi:hypothetical protein